MLRDGAWPARCDGTRSPKERLIELIAGRPLVSRPSRRCPRSTPRRRRARGHATSSGGPLRGVSFQLRQGEVLGVAGLLGSGRSELLKMVFGAYPMRSRHRSSSTASRCASATSARPWTPAIAYVPEDRGTRRRSSTCRCRRTSAPRWSAATGRASGCERGPRDADARAVDRRRSSSGPRPSSRRWARCRAATSRRSCWPAGCGASPKVLLLDEPTHGVDVGARAEIYELVSEAVADGLRGAARVQRLRGAGPRRRPGDRPGPRPGHRRAPRSPTSNRPGSPSWRSAPRRSPHDA